MKKYLLALLLVAGSRLGHAQGVHLGFKVGANFSRFVGSDVPDNDLVSTIRRFGIQAGVVAKLGFTSHWAIQPELLYSGKGNKTIYGGSTTVEQHLGYLDMPVLLKYTTHHIFVEAGPQLGLLLGATSTTSQGTSVLDEDNKSAFRTTDVGYILGVGAQDTNGLLLGVRYNGGLLLATPNDYQARNSSFQLYVGYLFGSAKP